MAVTFYRSRGNQAVHPYSRLVEGSTWGLRSAAKELARLAKNKALDYYEIRGVLSKYPDLAYRLRRRNFTLTALPQGITQKDLMRLFRFVLYKKGDISDLEVDCRADEPIEPYSLEEFADSRRKAYRSSELDQIKSALGELSSKERIIYLASLTAAKIGMVEGGMHPETLQALAVCKEIEYYEILGVMHHSRTPLWAQKKAFDRVKRTLQSNADHLRPCFTHRHPQIRREAFGLYYDFFTREELEASSPYLIDIPAIFSHPKASSKAKLNAIGSSVLKVRCPESLREFFAIATPAEKGALLAWFRRYPGNPVVQDNLEYFEWLIEDQA
ncbi:MAG: hypothetical protein HQ596_01035 [Candidatus Saganbacteria bacterium]|nr:hypothetical protein [Candidatus Saganbacteria bacterium]